MSRFLVIAVSIAMVAVLFGDLDRSGGSFGLPPSSRSSAVSTPFGRSASGYLDPAGGGSSGPTMGAPPGASPHPAAPGSSAPASVAPSATRSLPSRAPATPSPGRAPPPPGRIIPPPAGQGYLLLTSGQLRALPTSGPAWVHLKGVADGAAGTPDIADQDDDTDQVAFAKALVFARTGIASYRTQVLKILAGAVGSEAGGRTLALGRNLTGYVFAADLISLSSADPTWDTDVFRPWLRRVLTEPMSEGVDLITTAERRPSNWGTYAGASWAAVAAYLGDPSLLSEAANVFHGWLGDRAAYAGFNFEAVALSWSPVPSRIVGIDPQGSTIAGHTVDGILPSDMSRGGAYTWPPGHTGYAWEGLAGAYEEAEILARRGYPTYAWSNQALRRAVDELLWLDRQFGYWFDYGESPLHANSWIPWLANARYGAGRYPVVRGYLGRGMSFADWLYGS